MCGLLLLWVSALAVYAAAWRRPVRELSLTLSIAAAVPPFGSFMLFLWVFVIGGSSNVAQMAGGGYDLWSLWLHAFPVVLFSNGLGAFVGLVPLTLPPYPPSAMGSFIARAAATVAAAAGFASVVGLAPDA